MMATDIIQYEANYTTMAGVLDLTEDQVNRMSNPQEESYDKEISMNRGYHAKSFADLPEEDDTFQQDISLGKSQSQLPSTQVTQSQM